MDSGILKEDECMICLVNKVNVKTICNHLYCEKCIKAALKINNFCPYCRRFDPLNDIKEEKRKEKESKIDGKDWNL